MDPFDIVDLFHNGPDAWTKADFPRGASGPCRPA